MRSAGTSNWRARRTSLTTVPGSWIFRLLRCWLAFLLPCLPAAAQELIAGEYRIAATADRELVVLPSTATSIQTQLGLGPIDGRSYETLSQRIHVVSFDGEIFRAATPLEGASSRIVFDPKRRKFVQLLPSIRVELEDYAALDSIAEAIGAESATAFEQLGFAIIDLPETIHPVDAIAELEALPERPKASIRIRGPRVRWR